MRLSVPNSSLPRQADPELDCHCYLPLSKWTLESVSSTLASSFISQNNIYKLNGGFVFSPLIHNLLDHCNHFGFTGLRHRPPMLANSLWHRPVIFNNLLLKILLNYHFIPTTQISYFRFFPK